MFDRIKRLIWQAKFRWYGVHCGKMFSQGAGSYVHINPKGYLEIGDRLNLNRNVIISTAGGGSVVIGNDVYIGSNTVVISSNHDLNNHSLHIPGTVVIRDNVWIGANCVILPDVTIGEGAVVGAGSIVTKDVPEHTVACGNPARVIQDLAARAGIPPHGYTVQTEGASPPTAWAPPRAWSCQRCLMRNEGTMYCTTCSWDPWKIIERGRR